jgi:translation initiation factor 5A
MSDEEQQEVETFDGAGDAGASHTFPQAAGLVRKGAHAMLGGFPCKVIDVSTSKTGKHGHAKCNIVGLDIFTGKKHQDLCPSSHNMNIPFVKRLDYQCLDVMDDGFVSIMLDSGDTQDDLKCKDDEMFQDLKKAFDDDKELQVTVLAACGQEMIVDWKEASNSGD